ncbi:uncharacterized protein rftn1a isoform X2 [Cololabis saira]|nr:uncharacterized protein rftn1a isoform X2 [Cololabis saira]
MIQNYVKRIQDVAEQGVMFVGFLQQPGGGPYFLGHWDPEEMSSLHSTPSPIHRHPFSANASPTDTEEPHPNSAEALLCRCGSEDLDPGALGCSKRDLNSSVPSKLGFSFLKHAHASAQNAAGSKDQTLASQTGLKNTTNERLNHTKPDADMAQNFSDTHRFSPSPPETTGTMKLQRLPEVKRHSALSAENHFNLSNQRERRGSSSDSWLSSPELDHDRKSHSTHGNGRSRVKTHNNNHIRLKSSEKDEGATSPPAQARMQLFALYNHTEELNSSPRFYSLRVPLQVQKEAGLVTDVDANWLDHMTQHFTSGAHLIDGFFHLTDDYRSGISSVDSVFILQSSAEDTTNSSYDAIVVEQWTVVDGVVVKTDYIPLLQSLAPYGWRLMCVLPTPIVKTNSDGSLSTKQILFLQRPTLQRKRKDFKMLNLRGRGKLKKNPAGEALDEHEKISLVIETEMDTLRINTEKEGENEGRKDGDSARSKRASLQRSEEDALHQKSYNFLLERRASVESREEESEIDEILLSTQENTVRWTDFCQKGDGGVKEDLRTEERIKQQLFSGVC